MVKYHIMKNNRIIIGIVFTSGILIFAVINYLIDGKKHDELYHKLLKEYPTLLIKESINAEVVDIYKYSGNYSNNPFAVKFTTKDNKKLTIYSYKCINNSEINLGDIFKVGSKLKKTNGTDTLEVVNNNIINKFIIKESY